MTVAFVASGSLMIALGLAWLLRPIGARVGMQRETARGGHGKTNLALLAIVPSATIALYAALGRFDAIDPPIDADRAAAETMVARLASRLEITDDVAGLRLLARSYLQLQRPAEATRTYRRLVAIRPDDAGLEVDLAEALAAADGGRIGGEAMRHIGRALALDADEPRALAMAANEAVERDDPDAAIRYWTHLRALVPADSAVARSLRQNIAEAGERAAAKQSPR